MTPDQLRAKLSAMLDPLDIPLSWTIRDVNAYEEQRRVLTAKVSDLNLATRVLEEVDPQITTLTTQRDDLRAIRAELCDERLASTKGPNNRTARGLEISILAIDGLFDWSNDGYPTPLPLFEKLKARGYVAPPTMAWNLMAALFGSLPAIEWKLKELGKKRDEARARLDSVLRESVPV